MIYRCFQPQALQDSPQKHPPAAVKWCVEEGFRFEVRIGHSSRGGRHALPCTTRDSFPCLYPSVLCQQEIHSFSFYLSFHNKRFLPCSLSLLSQHEINSLLILVLLSQRLFFFIVITLSFTTRNPFSTSYPPFPSQHKIPSLIMTLPFANRTTNGRTRKHTNKSAYSHALTFFSSMLSLQSARHESHALPFINQDPLSSHLQPEIPNFPLGLIPRALILHNTRYLISLLNQGLRERERGEGEEGKDGGRREEGPNSGCNIIRE